MVEGGEGREEQQLWQQGQGPCPAVLSPGACAGGSAPPDAPFPGKALFHVDAGRDFECVRRAAPSKGFGRSQTGAGDGEFHFSLLSKAVKA